MVGVGVMIIVVLLLIVMVGVLMTGYGIFCCGGNIVYGDGDDVAVAVIAVKMVVVIVRILNRFVTSCVGFRARDGGRHDGYGCGCSLDLMAGLKERRCRGVV